MGWTWHATKAFCRTFNSGTGSRRAHRFPRAGVAGWILRYRHGGRRRELTIGRYPDSSLAVLRIEEARGNAMKCAPEGRFPVTRRGFGADVPNQGQEHSAGTCAEAESPCVGAAIRAARGGVARKAGPRPTEVRRGCLRAWLFLASASWVQGRQHAEEQHGVLASQVRKERPARRRGSTRPQASRLASLCCLGMRAELDRKVGTRRAPPCGTNVVPGDRQQFVSLVAKEVDLSRQGAMMMSYEWKAK